MEKLKKLTEILPLFSSGSYKGIDTDELNVAATLASMSVKILDTMSTMYQMHTNMVKLGQNLDTIVNALNSHIRDSEGTIRELKMRVDDLELMRAADMEKPS